MRRRRLLVVLCAVLLGTLAPAPPAGATDGIAAIVGIYCAGNGATGVTVCTTGVTAANRGLLIASVNLTAQVGVGTKSSVLVGQLFADLNGGGAGYNLYGTQACSGGVVRAAVPNLGAFNDLTSSYYGYSGCSLQLWANASYAGSSHGPASTVNYVGAAFNDLATSVKAY